MKTFDQYGYRRGSIIEVEDKDKVKQIKILVDKDNINTNQILINNKLYSISNVLDDTGLVGLTLLEILPMNRPVLYRQNARIITQF